MKKLLLMIFVTVVLTLIPAQAAEIHDATAAGDKVKVEKLLTQGVDVNNKDAGGMTPLFFAQNTDMAQLLIDKGADLNIKNNDKFSVLGFAINKHYDIGVIKLLIEKGANVNMKAELAGTTPKIYLLPKAVPLALAAGSDNIEAAKLLISKGANVNAQNRAGDTPLHIAARAGYQDMIDLLISHGAQVNVRNVELKTPAMVAQKSGIRMGLWFNQLLKWQF